MFYFSMDNSLPVGGYLYVGIPAGATFTPTSTSANAVKAWELVNTFTVPTTGTTSGTCKKEGDVHQCTFTAALKAGTAYGMSIPGSGSKAGAWGPVSMESRMNNVDSAGPIRDVNRVFDTINVAAKPLAITLGAKRIDKEGAAKKEFPKDVALMEFAVSFGAWSDATKVVPAGWNLKLMLST
jgi:hypothetical protein